MDPQGIEIREALPCGFQGVGGAFVELDDTVYRTRQGPEYTRHIEHAAPERRHRLAVDGGPVLQVQRADPRPQLREHGRRVGAKAVRPPPMIGDPVRG